MHTLSLSFPFIPFGTSGDKISPFCTVGCDICCLAPVDTHLHQILLERASPGLSRASSAPLSSFRSPRHRLARQPSRRHAKYVSGHSPPSNFYNRFHLHCSRQSEDFLVSDAVSPSHTQNGSQTSPVEDIQPLRDLFRTLPCFTSVN